MHNILKRDALLKIDYGVDGVKITANSVRIKIVCSFHKWQNAKHLHHGPYLIFVLSRQNVRQQHVPEPSRRIMEMHVCIGHCFDEHLANAEKKNTTKSIAF